MRSTISHHVFKGCHIVPDTTFLIMVERLAPHDTNGQLSGKWSCSERCTTSNEFQLAILLTPNQDCMQDKWLCIGTQILKVNNHVYGSHFQPK